MTVANSIKAQLDEATHVMRQQMVRIAELEAEVERLRSAAGAHEVLRSIYADANQPTGHRIKAAGLAIGRETPKLMPERAAIDATCEEVEPLSQLVERQRARMNRLLSLSLEERSRLITGVGRDDGNGGNGSDDTAG
jgi:hypothetical protein